MNKTIYFSAIKGLLIDLETAVKHHRNSMTEDVFNQIHQEKDLDFTANWNLKGAYVPYYIEKHLKPDVQRALRIISDSYNKVSDFYKTIDADPKQLTFDF